MPLRCLGGRVGGRGGAWRVLKQGSECAREQVEMRPVLLDSKN